MEPKRDRREASFSLRETVLYPKLKAGANSPTDRTQSCRARKYGSYIRACGSGA